MREGERGRLLLPFEKAEKLLGSLSQEDFGSGGDAGESCLTPAPHMSFTHSFKQYSPLQIVSVEQDNEMADFSTGLPVHWNTRLCSHTPRAHTFLLPRFSLVFAMLFFSPQARFFFPFALSCEF